MIVNTNGCQYIWYRFVVSYRPHPKVMTLSTLPIVPIAIWWPPCCFEGELAGQEFRIASRHGWSLDYLFTLSHQKKVTVGNWPSWSHWKIGAHGNLLIIHSCNSPLPRHRLQSHRQQTLNLHLQSHHLLLQMRIYVSAMAAWQAQW